MLEYGFPEILVGIATVPIQIAGMGAIVRPECRGGFCRKAGALGPISFVQPPRRQPRDWMRSAPRGPRSGSCSLRSPPLSWLCGPARPLRCRVAVFVPPCVLCPSCTLGRAGHAGRRSGVHGQVVVCVRWLLACAVRTSVWCATHSFA